MTFEQDSLVEADAREFGLHVRQGGWRMGLVVARNVERVGPGARTDLGQMTEVKKLSAQSFAERAGLSGHKQVIRYLDRWNEVDIPEEKFSLNVSAPGKKKDGNIHQQMMEHVYAILKLESKWTPEQAEEVKPGKSEKDLRAVRNVARFFIEDVDPAVAKKGTPLRAVGG